MGNQPRLARQLSLATITMITMITMVTMLCTSIAHGDDVLSRAAFLGGPFTAGPQAPQEIAVELDTMGGLMCVDAGVVFDALMRTKHDEPLSLGDRFFAIDIAAATREQVATALDWKPTIVFALDFLVWPAYLPRSELLTAAQKEAAALASVNDALAQLDAFTCPVVVGDVPDLRTTIATTLDRAFELAPTARTAVNARIHAWCAERANRVVAPFAQFSTFAAAGAPFELCGRQVDGEMASHMLNDYWRAMTVTGLTVLLSTTLGELEQRGLIERGRQRTETAEINPALIAAMKSAFSHARPWIKEPRSVGSLYTLLEATDRRNDDAAAASIVDSLLTRMESLESSPLKDDSLTMLVASGPMTSHQRPTPMRDAVVLRHSARIEAEIVAGTSNPTKTRIWLDLCWHSQTLGNAFNVLASVRAKSGRYDSEVGERLWFYAGEAGPASLAICFADLDEAIDFAVRAANESDARRRQFQFQNPNQPINLEKAGAPFLRLIASRKGEHAAEDVARITARAEAAGFAAAIAAKQRESRIVKESQNAFVRLRQLTGISYLGQIDCENWVVEYGSTSTLEKCLEASPDLGPRMQLWAQQGEQLRAMPQSPPQVGFGWLEGMNGAVCIPAKEIVITRAVAIDASGVPTLERIASSGLLAATWWVNLPSASPEFRRNSGNASDVPILAGAYADIGALRIALRAAIVTAPSEPHKDPQRNPNDIADPREPMWPIGFVAEGRIATAVVRIPRGWDAESRVARFATVHLHDQLVDLVGCIGERDSTTFIVWGEGSSRFTGEVVSFTNLELTDGLVPKIMWKRATTADPPPAVRTQSSAPPQ